MKKIGILIISFVFGLAGIAVVNAISGEATVYNPIQIIDTMDKDWTIIARRGATCAADQGYSSAIFTSPPASIFSYLWGVGAAGQDWGRHHITKSFDLAGKLERFKLNYYIDEMTSGMVGRVRIIIKSINSLGEKKEVGSYIVACRSMVTGQYWTGNYCSAIPGWKYVDENSNVIPAPGWNRDLVPTFDTWHVLDRNVSQDFDFDWTDSQGIEIEILPHGAWMLGDRFKTYYDDLFLKVIPISIPATIDIDPDTLNLNAKGKWVTVYVEFPTGYDVSLIDIGTPDNPLVFLEGVIPAETDPKYDFVSDPNEYLIDHDGDGILERLLKFDRQALSELLKAVGAEGPTTLTVSGEIIAFEGTDTTKVISKGGGPEANSKGKK